MGAVGLLVAADLRRRWRSVLAVALLLGLGGAVVLTALAGDRRTQSAYHRLNEATLAAHASVEVSPDYFDEIAALPSVENVAPASFLFVEVPGLEDEDVLSLAPVDERWNRLIDQPLLVDGRRPAPDRIDEMMIDSRTAERLGIDVGQQLTLTSLAPTQLEPLIAGEDPGQPAGPAIDVTVVGTGRTEEDIVNGTSVVLLTPAFYDRYRSEIAHFDDILSVRLRGGELDLPAFEDAVDRVVPASEGVVVESLAETSAEVQDATRVQAASLAVFAGAVALAVFMAAGQALARQAVDASGDSTTLRSLGVSRTERLAVLLAPGLVVAVTGSALAVGLALLGSSTMPIGFARRIEPHPGAATDGLVLGVGFAVMVVLVAARALLSAWRTTGWRARAQSTGRSRAVGHLAAFGATPALLVGVGLALEQGRGRTAVPVRPALVGAAAGVAGLAAALTFGTALRETVTDPGAYGVAWDTNVLGPGDPGDLDRQVSVLAENGGVEAVAALSVLPIQLAGVPAQSYGLEAVKGGGFVTVLEGRAPQGSTEVLVGSGTLDRLDRDVGDTITAEPLQGGAVRELTIVGRGVFPEFVHPAVPDSDTGAYNDFALLTRAGSDALSDGVQGEYFGVALVRWAPGVDSAAEAEHLLSDGSELSVVDRPERFVNLERVDAFPWVVAAFLTLVAVAVTGHALAMSVRRGAADLAVLRTMGFDGRRVRATLAWQATTLAVVGITAGVPIGLVVGRAAWTVIADRLGIDIQIPLPWLGLAMIVPAALVVTNVLAIVPGRRAVRTRPAVALRSE
jgi:ABC-type lipoprotein release transport system permease subunit